MNVGELAEFTALNRRRADYWHGPNHWTRSDWLTAALGEFGEAANYSKKLKRIEDGLAGNRDEDGDADVLREKMREELADFATYVDLVVSYSGQPLNAFIVTLDRTPYTTRSDLFRMAAAAFGKAADRHETDTQGQAALLALAVGYASLICTEAGGELLDEMRSKFDRVSDRVGYHEKFGG